jgi:hypothetical protein
VPIHLFVFLYVEAAIENGFHNYVCAQNVLVTLAL